MEIPGALFLLGVVVGVIAAIYFVIRSLRRDHERGDFHFTWGVGVVVLFLLGFAPGGVGLGLFLTVERHFPVYWLVLAFAVALAALLLTASASQRMRRGPPASPLSVRSPSRTSSRSPGPRWRL